MKTLYSLKHLGEYLAKVTENIQSVLVKKVLKMEDVKDSLYLFHVKIDPQKEVKISPHEGIFTRDYVEKRAQYDFQIRSWEVYFDEPFFYIKNTHDIEKVFIYYDIFNCSCDSFVQNQTGTCMHIECLKHLPRDIIDKFSEINDKLKPIIYITKDFEIKKRGSGDNLYYTVSIENFLSLTKRTQIVPEHIEIQDYNIFKEYGIDLFEYQKESIYKMMGIKKCILTLPPGRGKTVCALFCSKLLDKQKIIIICPNNLKPLWAREIDRFHLGDYLIIFSAKDIEKYCNQKFLIIGYQMLNGHRDILEKDFDIGIVDEIQKINNKESKTWQTLSLLKAERLFGLSGTPIQNSIDDLVSIMDIINPYEMLPKWKFYEEFCIFSKARLFGIQADKAKDLKKKFDKYIINPKIDSCIFKMPTKNVIQLTAKLSDAQQEAIEHNMQLAQVYISKSMEHTLSFGERAILNGLLTKARMANVDMRLLDDKQTKSDDRINIVIQKAKEIVGAGNKICIFSEWIKVLDFVAIELKANNIQYTMFNGKLSQKNRDKNLLDFIEDPNIKIFLSTDSGGVGIDGLQFVCHNIIHVENVWNNARVNQREGRLIRVLQKSDTVNVYYIKSDSSIEGMIENANIRKKLLVSEVL
jgi:SNF2 family DNA or RNA helicase